MAEEHFNQRPNDEISLKELVLIVQSYIKAVLSKWIWVALVAIFLAGGLAVRAWMTEVNFIAELTFLVNEDDGQSLGGVGAVLGQFGLGGANSEYNLDKIVELAKSRKIVQTALLKEVEIEGEKDFLANFLIQELNLHEDWQDSKRAGFLFTNDSIPSFDWSGRSALKMLYSRVVTGGDEKPLMSLDYDDATTILSLKSNTTDEKLSLALTDALYSELSQFYIEQSIAKPRQTYENLLQKSDSIQVELASAERSLARNQDGSLGLVRAQDNLSRNRLERKVQLLTVMYGEVLKNTEAASFALKNATPFFQIIDTPMSPLPAIGAGWLRAGMLGFGLGIFLMTSFFVTQKFWRDLMASK